MKLISKIMLVIALVLATSTIAFAKCRISTVKPTLAPNSHDFVVTVHNFSNDVWDVHSISYPSGDVNVAPVTPNGTPHDTIYITVYGGDDTVCVKTVREFDGTTLDWGCLGGPGEIDIPDMLSKKSK